MTGRAIARASLRNAVLKNLARKLAGPGAWTAAAALCFLAGYSLDAFSLKSAIFAALAAAGALVLALPYHWSVCFLFAFIAVEGMAKIITNYNPIVHVGSDLLVISLCARWLLGKLWRRERFDVKLPPLAILFTLHLVWFLIEFVNPYSIGLVPSLAGFKVYGTLVLVYLLGYYLSSDLAKVRKFMFVWAMIALLQIVTSLQQAAMGPASVLRISPGYAAALEKFQGYAFRPFGTTNGAGAGSIFLFLTFPFLVYFVVTSRKLAKLPYAVMLPLSVVTLLLCQVRASIAKAAIGGIAFVAASLTRLPGRLRVQVLVVVVVAGAAMAVTIPRLSDFWVGAQADNARALERSLSVLDFGNASEARAGGWEKIFVVAEMAPLGAGLSHAGAAAGKFWDLLKDDPFFPGGIFADNFYAMLIAELGIPGALILTTIIFRVLWQGFTGWRRLRSPALVLCNNAISAAFFASFVGLWGAEGMVYNPESTFCWFFAGVLMRLPDLDRDVNDLSRSFPFSGRGALPMSPSGTSNR